MPDLSEEQDNLLWDTRKAVEAILKERLKYLELSQLKSYVKVHDVNLAMSMMRERLPPEILDDKIASSCHYLGNSLNTAAQELVRDTNYRPKMKTRSMTYQT